MKNMSSRTDILKGKGLKKTVQHDEKPKNPLKRLITKKKKPTLKKSSRRDIASGRGLKKREKGEILSEEKETVEENTIKISIQTDKTQKRDSNKKNFRIGTDKFYSFISIYSFASVMCILSALSTTSILGVFSVNSILSVLSVNSILSIMSTNCILCLNCHDKIMCVDIY